MTDHLYPPPQSATASASTQEPREPIMQFFAWGHLPVALQEVSAPFGRLAEFIHTLPRCAERSAALRHLIEAKDAAVRAKIFKP